MPSHAATHLLPPEFAEGAARWAPPPITGAQRVFSAPEPDARETAEAALRRAQAQGHAEGYAAGLREARDQAARVSAVLDHLAQPLAQLDHELERALIGACMQAARRLVAEELELHPDKVAGAVREAVAALGDGARELRIHLHPQDAQLLRDSLSLETEAAWKLVPDATLARGDCRINSEAARVDARLATRAAEIERHLLGDEE